MPDQLTKVQQLIQEECEFISAFLITKNKAYGDSVTDPVNIFAKSSPTEQLNVRIDDKIKRLLNSNKGAKSRVREDTVLDLVGYLILKRVLTKLNKFKPETTKNETSE